MSDNPKFIALLSVLGIIAVSYGFWHLYGDQYRDGGPAATQESAPIIITDVNDLPEGVPPPPPPPDFNKNSFQIPGTTDGMATPTEEELTR